MDSATKILDIAEIRMRRTGYNAVSFRDIANEMGLKSASLHYHFPKKSDLGEALVRRYALNFRSALNDTIPANAKPAARLAAFVDIYRSALRDQDLVCLCAVLGAEAPGLPKSVANEVRKFFEENIDWLSDVFETLKSRAPRKQAQATLAALEGAMIVAAVNDDMDVFEAVADQIVPEWIK